MEFLIGGEFEIRREELAEAQPARPFAAPDHSLFTDTGRSALYLALQAVLQHGGSREAWLPTYCCASVKQPFRQLGFAINYYSMGEDLQTPNGLPAMLNKSTFLFIHYFGKKNKAILKWLAAVKREPESIVIEDCVMASLSEDVGKTGDFSLRSFRKFLPQPDGAQLTYEKSFRCELQEADETFISKKIIGKVLRGAQMNEAEYLAMFAECEEQLDGPIIPRRMSWISQYLFEKADLPQIRERRRENWLVLQKMLADRGLEDQRLKSLYTELETEEVPLGYPVLVKDGMRNELRNHLRRKRIFCAVHWPLEENAAKAEAELSAQMLTLPIDQRLTQAMLEYMVDALADFYR